MPDYTPGDPVVISDTLKAQMTQYIELYTNILLKNFPPSDTSHGATVYGGSGGMAMVLLRLYLNTKNTTYLTLSMEYIKTAIAITRPSQDVGFLEGYSGVYGLAAIIYAASGDKTNSQLYINQFLQVVKSSLNVADCTYLGGKAGVLMGANLLNNYFGASTIPRSDIVNLAYQMLQEGVHSGQKYLSYVSADFGNLVLWGEGHGSSGVINQFLDIPEITSNQTALTLLKNTIDYYVSIQLPDGNFPTPTQAPFPTEPDVLVQWCHGAPGFMPVLTKAYYLFNDNTYLQSAEKAANCTWERGILTKGLMLCHGVSGNTYMFLNMHRRTQNPLYLYRAIKFQEYTFSHPILVDPNQMRKPTPSPYTFWDGSYASAIPLWSDFLTPNSAYYMPGFDPYP
jgi:lantibiotic modifying enzyme